jgi:hypothetical protein
MTCIFFHVKRVFTSLSCNPLNTFFLELSDMEAVGRRPVTGDHGPGPLRRMDADEAALCVQLGLPCCQAIVSDWPDINILDESVPVYVVFE